MNSNYWKAILVGLLTGVLFTMLKLDIPAPVRVSSLLGILGLFSGMILVTLVQKGSVSAFLN
jgi:XapX domain-containing protein